MKAFRPAKRRIRVSVGESVRILRELQELSQNELSRRSGIPQATLSAIENDRVKLGVERAKVLARTLKCHPAVLVFPGWDVAKNSAA
jgi:transcriptional regulator with XRE-family HTH domain